ncbi:lysine--tRNA ligase [Spirochaeta africana]|uniref:Lysine--tRNA ligase n=1 Tax=Spirochaeta africana (strain ATCC 700263 / DSM 8902 / Z-7692) TaxID=889378 RepID=H9UGB6_SPIAZ|nr:lysine--tRNA ligase [Spirochaeta africana]AFG36559.1 lysyl-tRNA synthetase, archaeal and spirochete [Spirochaeta africana DSM 8902]
MSTNQQLPAPNHWADVNAHKIIRTKGEKERYTCASGITPSGTVHIGNFREIISVDLVARALQDHGRQVRFLYSWDDYDVFRKVPKNMPQQEMLQQYLRYPITRVPDPFGEHESYARHNEAVLEVQLERVGINPEYIYQAGKYQASDYAKDIRTALEHRETIRAILNEHRTTPLPDAWWPVSVFSEEDHTDEVDILSWDGEWELTYRTRSTGSEHRVDLRTTGVVKLPWRVDWPMRWAYEQVDFEPAGKEHHSAGGSFDTAREVASAVYNYEAPVTFKYDFISIKGQGGKISSSLGNVVDLADALEIYQPEIVRYLFASSRPNAEFAISFDLDVIKIYEDYDRCERIYYGVDQVKENRAQKERRIYELSQVDRLGHTVDGTPLPQPEDMPFQVPFRHLCNMLLISAGNIEQALDSFSELKPEHRDRARVRAACAWNWIQKYAPEDFRFTLKTGDEPAVVLTDDIAAAVRAVADEVEQRLHEHTEKSLQDFMYTAARSNGVEPVDLFTNMYRILIAKDAGPRLAGFIFTIGRERFLHILRSYR